MSSKAKRQASTLGTCQYCAVSLSPVLLLPALSKTNQGLLDFLTLLIKDNGGYLGYGLTFCQPQESGCFTYQDLSVSAAWQLLAEEKSAASVYAKYVHVYIQIQYL